MEHEWIKIDKDIIDKPREVEFRGLQIQVTVSPYDLPEAVRSYTSDDGQLFVIEFKYIGEEETVRKGGGSIHIHTGRNSQRLYKIEIGVNSLVGAERGVRLQMVESAIQTLGNDPAHRARKTNYDVVREVILESHIPV